MKKLPVGLAVFQDIRREGYIYVDKTRQIHQMVTGGKYYFLSRPRRFGKSLLVSTLWNLFEGKRELFEGLWIAEHGDWAWQKHAVITLDFNEIAHDTPQNLEISLNIVLTRTAKSAKIILETPLADSKFQELILALYQQSGLPVVVLIDEYDKPLIDHIGQGEERLKIAKANRDILKRFFGVLKGINILPALRFVLLTGVSKFSKVSIFSELNNLTDLTMAEDYADMFGYTQAELESNFKEHLVRLAQKHNWTSEQLIQELAYRYNGYRFSEREVKVYNPFSILHVLNSLALKNYWFESGTPTFLINLLKQEQYDLPSLEKFGTASSVFTTYEIDNLKSKIRFEIEDTGVGIESDNIAKIFEPFEQVGEVKKRDEGTGLGLAITRQLVQLMGGELRVKSELGKGSTFWFEIDLCAASLQETMETKSAQRQIMGYQGTRRKVLVVDDKLDNRAVLAGLLMPLGFAVTEAEDGLQALKQVKADCPDLIITDLVMPVMTGFEFMEHVRAMPELAEMKIIVSSASAIEMHGNHSAIAHSDGFISKPVDIDRLLELIQQCLGLQWEYEGRGALPVEATPTEGELVLPPLEELQTLATLVKGGNMRKVRQHIQYIAELGAQYKPFTEQISALAVGYEVNKLRVLVQEYLERAR